MTSPTTTDERLALPSGALLHITGPRDAAGVLFLHGVGGGAWSWAPQTQALRDRYRLYVWEARGHGDAGRVADAGLGDYYIDALEAAAAASAQSGPVAIAGHSMGGLLALAVASERPEQTRALFLVDPVYSDGTDTAYGHVHPSLAPLVLALCEPLLRSFERGGPVSRIIARRMFALSFRNRDRMEAAWPAQARQVPIEYGRMLRESFTRPTGFPMRDFAREIQAPTMLIECERNEGGARFPAFAATLRERLGDRFSTVALPGGHYLQLDTPDAVNAALQALLANAGAPPAQGAPA